MQKFVVQCAIFNREAERLLLWAIVVKGKPAVVAEHAGPRRIPRHVPARSATRRALDRARPRRTLRSGLGPFVGPLSECSRDTARRILNAMGAWLVGQPYLRVNPFAGPPAAPSVPIDATGRTLTRAQWQYVLRTVLRPQSAFDVSGEDAATARDAFLLLFAYATGLRQVELAATTTGALTRTALDGALDDAWSLRVQGKGRCRSRSRWRRPTRR